MTRRCSHCSNNGHNSRTCPTRSSSTTPASGASSSDAPAASLTSSSPCVKLFGVRLTDGSIIKKSASMGNLLHYHSSSSAAASPSSDHVTGGDGHMPDGYLSDDPTAHGGSNGSNNRRGERKKGVPWTEEEHRLFLVGLQKLGKGDWRGIARNYVVSRTPTQVASHAQKYFIRQSNASRRKRRSSLFDMIPDVVTETPPLPEEQELPASLERETDDTDSLPSLNLSLKPDYEPMETSSEEPTKKPDATAMESDNMETTIPRSSELPPAVPGSIEFTPFTPGFFTAYVPVPYPLWAPAAAPVDDMQGAETSQHQVLKPVPVFPKEPVNVDELLGMSHLTLGETGRDPREPAPLSLKLIGEPSRQSAFHANPPLSAARI